MYGRNRAQRNRAQRNRAAALGLSLLMGISFLGCHGGPRLLTKKDRDDNRVANKDDSNKSKFINRKKARPENDYLREEEAAEQVAKAEAKGKSKSKSAGDKASDEIERAAALRARRDETATASKTKSTKSSSEIARRDTKRLATDALDDPLLEESLPSTRTTLKPASRSLASSKVSDVDEDPFKNTVVSNSHNKRANGAAATNSFDDLSDDDDLDEEGEELEEMSDRERNQVARTSKSTSRQMEQAATNAGGVKRKFLPTEFDELSSAAEPDAWEQAQQAEKTVNRKTQGVQRSLAKSNRDPSASLDKNGHVRETIQNWQREMDQTEASQDDLAAASSAKSSLVRRSQGPRFGGSEQSSSVRNAPRQGESGHISQTTLEEFLPDGQVNHASATKSKASASKLRTSTSQSRSQASSSKPQGAVLNGELIIDTASLPNRFQRSAFSQNDASQDGSPTDMNSRVRSNSAASIDIVPGATQNRPRPAGQISLQSLNNRDEKSSEVESANYEQTSTAYNELQRLPALSDPAGPKLVPPPVSVVPGPINESESIPLASAKAKKRDSISTRGWAKALLVFGSVTTALLIGLALRRRKELVPVPVRTNLEMPPIDPSLWPRG